MDDYPAELDFLNQASASLTAIQNVFDVYQQAHFPARAPEFFALELNGEAGELANIEKKAWKGKEVDPARFADEAADVFIALVNYCNARSIDRGPAVAEKVREIETRRRQGRM